MANHYFKDKHSYYKLVDETHEVFCVTTNFTNKCIAISVDNTGQYETMRDMYIVNTPTGIELISEELFEAKRDIVKDYIIEFL